MNKRKDVLTVLIFLAVGLSGSSSFVYVTSLLINRFHWGLFFFDIIIFNVACFGIFIFAITFKLFLTKQKSIKKINKAKL